MTTSLRIVVIGLAVQSIFWCAPCHAQSRSNTNVAKGFVLREVLATWGEPEERIVRGVKRQLVWRYKGGAYVVFKEGKVASFKTGVSESAEQSRKSVKAGMVKKATVVEENESKHVLRDILDEIPGGSADNVGAPPPVSDPNLAGLIPNPIPQRNNPPPGIAPGVVVPSIEGEEEDQMLE